MNTFHLPDLGEGLREAEIVAWHVAAGDHVVADQPLVSVETEKAVVEIPSPQSGHVARLLAEPGARVAVGAPLLEFETGAHSESTAIVGTLREAPPARAAESAAPRPADKVVASPAVRARARDLGIDLAGVAASGPGSSVTLADLDRMTTSRGAGQAELRGARRAMARNMIRAGKEVVAATLTDEVDIDTWSPGEDVTLRLLRAIAAGCVAEPLLNATFDGNSLSLRFNAHIDLGLAIDGPDGLLVPVLRDIAAKSRETLRGEIDDMKARALERSLSLDDMRNPTISVSNFGAIGGRYASLVVVPPGVAILGAGRAFESCVRAGSGIAMHRMLPLSLTFDHRAATGGDAARFLRAVAEDLQKPD